VGGRAADGRGQVLAVMHVGGGENDEACCSHAMSGSACGHGAELGLKPMSECDSDWD
jgi:hypothetical protein